MMVVTTPAVEGKPTAAVIGLVMGQTVRARHVGRDTLATLRWLIGGEVGQYSRLLQEARQQDLGRMIKQADDLGANAIVNTRYTTSMIMSGAAEILAYGTAVVIEQ